MKGFLFAWIATGLVWLQMFESAYRSSIKPNPVEYLAFALLVVFGWPYPLYLIFKGSKKVSINEK